MLKLYVASTIKKEGKTFVTAGLAATMQSLSYSTCVFKPIQTGGIIKNGFTQSPDLTHIKAIDPYINTHFSYLFNSSEEPLIASEQENEHIDIEFINTDYKRLISEYECTIVDGDSGVLSPISKSIQNVDLIKKLQIPVLFVIQPSNDVINNTLLNINLLQERDIDVRGVVVNNIDENCPTQKLTSITRTIEEYTNSKIIGLLPNLGEKVMPEDLISAVLNGIDVESVFGIKIEKLDL